MRLRDVEPGDVGAYVRMRCDPVMMAELGGPRPREGMAANGGPESRGHRPATAVLTRDRSGVRARGNPSPKCVVMTCWRAPVAHSRNLIIEFGYASGRARQSYCAGRTGRPAGAAHAPVPAIRSARRAWCAGQPGLGVRHRGRHGPRGLDRAETHGASGGSPAANALRHHRGRPVRSWLRGWNPRSASPAGSSLNSWARSATWVSSVRTGPPGLCGNVPMGSRPSSRKTSTAWTMLWPSRACRACS